MIKGDYIDIIYYSNYTKCSLIEAFLAHKTITLPMWNTVLNLMRNNNIQVKSINKNCITYIYTNKNESI